jgi:hypothetical protein
MAQLRREKLARPVTQIALKGMQQQGKTIEVY